MLLSSTAFMNKKIDKIQKNVFASMVFPEASSRVNNDVSVAVVYIKKPSRRHCIYSFIRHRILVTD